MVFGYPFFISAVRLLHILYGVVVVVGLVSFSLPPFHVGLTADVVLASQLLRCLEPGHRLD